MGGGWGVERMVMLVRVHRDSSYLDPVVCHIDLRWRTSTFSHNIFKSTDYFDTDSLTNSLLLLFKTDILLVISFLNSSELLVGRVASVIINLYSSVTVLLPSSLSLASHLVLSTIESWLCSVFSESFDYSCWSLQKFNTPASVEQALFIYVHH